MNCCDYNCNQGRDCPARATPTACDQLGVCKGLAPACPGCAHADVVRKPFAPGVIQGGPRPVPLRRVLLRYLTGAMVLVSLAYAAGYLVGTFAGA